MKKTLLMFSVLAGLLIAPAFCLGAISYTRTPSGYTISNPVEFQISNVSVETLSFKIGAKTMGGSWTYSTCYISTTSADFITDLPLAVYERVQLIADIETANCGMAFPGSFLEFNSGNPIFEVVEAPKYSCSGEYECVEDPGGIYETLEACQTGCQAPAPAPSGGVFTIPTGAVGTTTNVIGDLVDAIFPFIALFAGVPLAFYVIYRFIKILP